MAAKPRSMVFSHCQEKDASSWLTTCRSQNIVSQCTMVPFSHTVSVWNRSPSNMLSLAPTSHWKNRNLTVNLLSTMYLSNEPYNHSLEKPSIMPPPSLTMEQDLWGGHFEWKFFDVRILNPHAPSSRTSTPTAWSVSKARKWKEKRLRTMDQRCWVCILHPLCAFNHRKNG